MPDYTANIEDLFRVSSSKLASIFDFQNGVDLAEVISYKSVSKDEETLIDSPETKESLVFKRRFSETIERYSPIVLVKLITLHKLVEAYVGIGLSGDSSFGGSLPPPGSLVLVATGRQHEIAFIIACLTTKFTSRVSYGLLPEIKPGEFLWQASSTYLEGDNKILRLPRSRLADPFDANPSTEEGKLIELPGGFARGDWKGRVTLRSRQGESGFSQLQDELRTIVFDKNKDASVEIMLGNPVMETPILRKAPTGNGPFKGDRVELGQETDDANLEESFFDGDGNPFKVLKGLSIKPRIFPNHSGKKECNHYGSNEENFLELDISKVEEKASNSVTPSPSSVSFDKNVKESQKAKPIVMRIKAENATLEIDSDGNVSQDSIKDLVETSVNRYMESTGWFRVLSEKVMEMISHEGIILKGKDGVRLSDDAGNLIQIGSKGISILSKDKHTLTMGSDGIKLDGKPVLLEEGDAVIGGTGGIIQTLINHSTFIGTGAAPVVMSPALLSALQALISSAGTGRSDRAGVACT